MKRKLLIPICFLFSIACSSGETIKNSPDPEEISGNHLYEIATWKGFTKAVINYTFDDGCRNQYDVAIPMFDEYRFQLTIYLVANSIPAERWGVIKQSIAKGHEMGSHTVTHPSLAELSLEDQRKELSDSRKTIEEVTGTNTCHTIAYPFCICPDLELCSEYYIAGRDCRGDIEKATPDSYYRISSIGCGDLSAFNTTEAFTNKMLEATSQNGWCVFLLHGIDNDGGYSPVTSQLLRECLEYLDKNRDKYWVTSLLNAALYAKERDAAVISEKKTTKNEVTMEITHKLDKSIYNHPLTVRRQLSDKWENASVRQGGKIVESKVVIENNKKYVVFDAEPNKEEVVISKSTAR